MSISTWMPTLKANLAAVSGVAQVHTYTDLPGSIQVFPTIIVMPVSGTQSGGASAPGIAIHDVEATLYTNAAVLPEGLTAAVPFIALVRTAIYGDVQLGGNCNYCLPRTPDKGTFYELGGLTYGDKIGLCGIVFHLTVKEIESITITA